MTYEAIAAIINLLPIIRHQESVLISGLSNFYNFDHNIFLLDSSVDINRFLNTEQDTPQSLYTFNNTGNNITGLETLKEIKSKNVFLVVVSVGVNLSDLTFLNRIKNIQRLNKNMKIGVFYSDPVSTANLQKLFEWSWTHNIINIFAVIYPLVNDGLSCENSLNVFSFNPFGSFNVINVTGYETFDSFFLSQNSNFQQYTLRLGQVEIYTYTSDEKLWQAVLSVLNASFTVVEVNFDSVSDTKLLEYGTIDAMKTTYSFDVDDVVNMYPIFMEAFVIVVPEATPYSEISAYLRTLTSDNIIGYSMISIAAVMLLLTFFRYVKRKKILFFRSVVDVLNLLINDNGGIKYQNLSRIEAFLIVPLTFAGFVITNGILSTLKSYLTRPIFQPQINTVEDIYASPFPIFTHYEIWVRRATDVLGNLSKHSDWSDKFRLAEFEVVDKEMKMYNTSISFLERLSYANFALDNQKRLNIRGYHIPQLDIDKYVVSYPVHDDFPFIGRLNEIIHWIRDAGLYEKWRREDSNGFVINISKNIKSLKSREQSEVERFEVPMFIVYGWCTGGIVFVIEIIWKTLEFQCNFRE